MKDTLKVLVFDDNEINRAVAEAQLGKEYDLTVVGTYDEAQDLLSKETFDVVLTDLLVPPSMQMLGTDELEREFSGQEMPVGIFIGLWATVQSRAKYVAVFTDSDHHSHPASACFDAFNRVNRENWREGVRESTPRPFLVEESKVILSNARSWVEKFLPEDLSSPLDMEDERWYDENVIRAKNWRAVLEYLVHGPQEEEEE
jgi:CheY-like chemotaxis protein